MKHAAIKADLMLIVLAAIWGSGFVAQRAGMDSMGPFTFTSLRFAIGALVIAPVCLARHNRKRNETPASSDLSCPARSFKNGIWLGLLMAAAATVQQAGMVHTTASRGGFITGLYVLFVPIFGLFWKQPIRMGHIIGALLAAWGLYSLSGDLSGSVRIGDLLILMCAVLWALHVALLGIFAPKSDPLSLALTQFITVAVVVSIPALLFERDTMHTLAQGFLPLLYSGVFAIGIAFTLQIYAQQHAPPTHAAVLMSLEALFAAITGTLLLGERLSPVELMGCALMFAGMLVSQLWPHTRSAVEQAEIKDPVR